MNFRRVSPNGHFRALRLLSDGGRWELGFSPYHHGVRLRMGLAGRPPQVMDFCLGSDAELLPKVLVAVLKRLDPLDEMSTPEEVDTAFPWARTRPDLTVHLIELLDGRHVRFVHAEGPLEVPKLFSSFDAVLGAEAFDLFGERAPTGVADF